MLHVLLPTDYSDNSFHAALYAAHLLGRDGVEYTLVHTYLDADPSISSWTGMAEELYKAALDGMREWESRIKAAEVFQGATIRSEVIYGPLPALLNEMGAQHGADLVVMGTLGHSGAGVLGSNAVAVVKHSKFPVLVVPNKAKLQQVRRILFADDQRGVDAADMQVLVDLARQTASEVVLAHVLRTGDEMPNADLIARFDDLFKDIPHRFVAEEGKDAASAIDFLAAREEADMIAVMHRHMSFFEGLFRSSTAKRLTLYSDMPLLVLLDRDTW
ncbi:MAG TPA: universal stress protein [Flavobacteriales bacterium]|nr:universal stress protein [Flavobacteriales bacterium]